MARPVCFNWPGTHILAAGLLFLVGFAPPARASVFDDKPKLLLHVKALTTKNLCAWGNLSDCQSAVTQGSVASPGIGPFYFVYLLAAPGQLRGTALGGNGRGLAGLQCGLSYLGAPDVGVDIFTWNLCATLEFSSLGWPANGGGNLITWDSTNRCQLGEVAIAGFFYLSAYSSDALRLIPRPLDGRAVVADCSSVELDLAEKDLGFARFVPGGQAPGCNPCAGSCAQPVPVQPTSWGQIKGLYGVFSR